MWTQVWQFQTHSSINFLLIFAFSLYTKTGSLWCMNLSVAKTHLDFTLFTSVILPRKKITVKPWLQRPKSKPTFQMKTAIQCEEYQILREINSRQSGISKTALFAILGTLSFVILDQFHISKRAKIHKNQNSEPLNVSKWQILSPWIRQLWFHEKSEWQKIFYIFHFSNSKFSVELNMTKSKCSNVLNFLTLISKNPFEAPHWVAHRWVPNLIFLPKRGEEPFYNFSAVDHTQYFWLLLPLI